MQFLNRVKYDAAHSSGFVFTLTAKTGYETAPDASGNVMVLQDSAGNSARVLATIAGTSMTVTAIFSTSESDNTMPTFGAGLEAFSSDVAEVMQRPFCTAAAIISGQSNAVSWNDGKANMPASYFHEIDNAIRVNTFNLSPRGPFRSVVAIEPLGHLTMTLESPQSDTLGPGIPFAQELKREGWGEVEIFPFGINSAPISDFIRNGSNYNALRDALIEYLNADPRNKVIAWAHLQGETDNGLGTTEEAYRTALLNLVNFMKIDVQAATGVSIDDLCFLAVGLGGDYLAASGGATIEAAIASIPNYLKHSAYVPVPVNYSRANSSYESNDIDTTHHSAYGCLRIGRDLLIDGLKAARANLNPSTSETLALEATAPNLPLSGSTAELYTSKLTLEASAPNLPLSGSAAQLVTAEPLNLNATAPSLPLSGSTAELETTPAPQAPSIPNTLALSPGIVLRGDHGVTVDGSGNVSQWDDLSGNNRHVVANNGDVTYDASGNALVFDGASDLLYAAGVIDQNTATQGTIIIEFNGSAGAPHCESTAAFASFINIATNAHFHMAGSSGNGNWETINDTDLNDGNDHVVAMVLDATHFRVYHGQRAGGISEVFSETKVSPAASAMQTVIGGTNGGNYLNGQVKNYFAKNADALTLSEINDVIAEF